MFIIPDQGWVPGKSGIFSLWVYELLEGRPQLPFVAGIALVFVQAFLINALIARFRMANEVSLLPGLCYILLASSIPEFLYLSPLLMANTFFIIILFEIYGSYRQVSTTGNFFNIGFWLGVGSLFYFGEIAFLFFTFLGISILHKFSLKDILVITIGFVVPYFLSGVYFFWYDRLGWFWETQILSNLGFLDINLAYSWETYTKLIFFTLLFLMVLTSFNGYLLKKNFQIQKNLIILFWSLFFGILPLLFQSDIKLEYFLIFVVPLSVFLSFNLSNMRPQLAEALHFLLLAGILILQFKYYWW